MLKGKKTYIAGFSLMAIALGGLALSFAMPGSSHALGFDAAITLFMNGLGFVGVRHAIK